MKNIEKILTHHFGFVLGMTIFFLLLYHNPFSPANHIANLEPFPDTIYYVGGAIALAQGRGFELYRVDQSLKNAVPPLYSMALAPFMFIKSDARMFYYGNLTLALIAGLLFYLVVNHLCKNGWVKAIIFFFYVTSFLIFIYPTYALGENLVLPLFLGAILLLIQPFSRTRIILASVLMVALYGTKYVNLPLSAILFLLYGAKIYLESPDKKTRKSYWIVLLVSSVASYVVFTLFYHLITHAPFSLQSLFMLNSQLTEVGSAFLDHRGESEGHKVFFSFGFLIPHFIQYLSNFVAGTAIVAETKLPFLSGPIAIACLIAICVNCFWPKKNFTNIALCIIFWLMLIFISTFFLVDFRYVLFLLPLMLIGLGTFLDKLPKMKRVFPVVMAICYGFFALVIIPSATGTILANFFKEDIVLDNYYVVQLVDDFFNSHPPSNGKLPVLLSILPPYYFDYFSGHKYQVFPASWTLYVSNDPVKLYGSGYDYGNTLKLYKGFIEQGRDVYLLAYVDADRKSYFDDFNTLSKNFLLTQVQPGCNNNCNLYKLAIGVPSASSSAAVNGNIIVDVPAPNSQVGAQFVISGSARVFENQFNYRVKDATGKILAEGTGMSTSKEAGQAGAFSIPVKLAKKPATAQGTIEVFDFSAKDGAEIDKVVVPIKF